MPHYVKNPDLLREVILCKQKGELTPLAVQMFIKIATESNKKLKYRDPQDREDCISSAIEDMLKYWQRFDPAKSENAFAYFSQMAKHGFAKAWRKLHNAEITTVSLSEGIFNL